MDWKKALKMVVGIPETAKGVRRSGPFPRAPRRSLSSPPARSRSPTRRAPARRMNDRIVFYAPEGFEVSVTPADGGEPLAIREPEGAMVGKSPGPVAWREIANVEIPAAGSYRIASTPASPDRNEPRLLFAPA